jgi:hypothetical protein
MVARALLLIRVFSLLCVVPLAACTDVRSFAGAWAGPVVPDEPVLQGFAPDTRVEELLLADVDLRGLAATLTTSDGRFEQTRLEPVVKLASDPLATLTFDGSPIRSYLLFAKLDSEPQGEPAWLLISLFADGHVELRAIRGNDLFGVFQLNRVEP